MRRRIRILKKRLTPDENYLRVNNVLQSDKLPLSPECQEVALKDFKAALGEYFDVENLSMDVKEEGRGYSVSISFTTFRVKTFHLLK